MVYAFTEIFDSDDDHSQSQPDGPEPEAPDTATVFVGEEGDDSTHGGALADRLWGNAGETPLPVGAVTM